MKFLVFLVLHSICLKAWAGEIISAQASARSYPFSGNIEFQYRFEQLIWEKNKEVLFGFWAPKVSLASSGTAEVGLAIYPLSIWEVSASQSYTSRFYKIKKFDCDVQICGGMVERRKLGTKLIVGKKFELGTLFLVPSYQYIEMSHSDTSKPLADEAEMNLAQAGGENIIVEGFFVGWKMESDVWGALVRNSRYSRSDRTSESSYLVYRTKMNGLSYVAGLGTFKSEVFPKEASVIFQMGWQAGESVGLF